VNVAGLLGFKTRGATAEIEAARATITECAARAQEIERAPITKEIAIGRLREWRRQLRDKGPRPNVGTAAAADVPVAYRKPYQWRDPLVARDPENAILSAVLSFLPEKAVDNADEAVVAAWYREHDTVGMTDEARRKAREENAAKLLAAECAEERAIRAAEAAGDAIDRRPEADPAIVLAPDDELAGNKRPTTIVVPRLRAQEGGTTLGRAMLDTSAASERDAAESMQRAKMGRDAEKRSVHPSQREARAAQLKQHDEAVEHHTAEYERRRETRESIETRVAALAQLARRCREHANKLGVDRPRAYEPGVSSGPYRSSPQ